MTPPAPRIEAFFADLRRRLSDGQRRYSDRSFELPLPELVEGLRQEADLIGLFPLRGRLAEPARLAARSTAGRRARVLPPRAARGPRPSRAAKRGARRIGG